MNEEIFERVLLNQCTEEELKTVASWLKNEQRSIEKKRWIWLKKYWNRLDIKDEIPELSGTSLLDRTHHQMNLRINTTRKLSDESIEKPIIRLRKYLTRAAAILFIPLLLASMLYYLQQSQKPVPERNTEQKPIYQQITSPIGNKTRLELSDGSVVWLNHGSSLRFPLQFTGKKRMVHLEGEAYFEVESNASIPFIVRAGDLQFMAIGTKFNIMAYQNEDIVEATLQSGKITLQKVFQDQSVKGILTLAPNQQARYFPKEKQLEYYDVDPDNYISWKDGKLVMINDPFSRIARKLERWYNVKIDFTQEEIGYIRYSGTFTDETLPQVLELMKLAAPIDYTIYPREKKPDGTYSLLRVLISIKNGYKISVNTKNP